MGHHSDERRGHLLLQVGLRKSGAHQFGAGERLAHDVHLGDGAQQDSRRGAFPARFQPLHAGHQLRQRAHPVENRFDRLRLLQGFRPDREDLRVHHRRAGGGHRSAAREQGAGPGRQGRRAGAAGAGLPLPRLLEGFGRSGLRLGRRCRRHVCVGGAVCLRRARRADRLSSRPRSGQCLRRRSPGRRRGTYLHDLDEPRGQRHGRHLFAAAPDVRDPDGQYRLYLLVARRRRRSDEVHELRVGVPGDARGQRIP